LSGRQMNNRHLRRRLCAAFSMCAFLLQIPAAFADPVTGNLNLSSTTASVNPSGLSGSTRSVTINVGGKAMPVTSSSVLTPAQNLAVSQILSTGRQTISINAAGAAVGGTMSFTQSVANTIGNVSIPKGVRAAADFGINNLVNINGALTNAGQIQFYSSN